MVAASAALTLSGVPFMGPVGGARVGYINGEYVLNPHLDEMDESSLDLVVAGTARRRADGRIRSEGAAGRRHARRRHVRPQGLPAGDRRDHQARRSRRQGAARLRSRQIIPLSKTRCLGLAEDELREAYKITKKAGSLRRRRCRQGKGQGGISCRKRARARHIRPKKVGAIFKHLQAKIVRWNILDTKSRIDGRDLATVRPIVAEVGILPRTHGSALFTRGETQAIVVATLGTGEDEQYVDSLTGMYKENFMLHYNFPPYSVGETGRMGSPGRREIGHGKLAWRAIHPMLPSAEQFPYTLRVVSEITESNGSSSMATVCGTSLALMDAGVPLAKPVAGIAMGLIKEEERFAVLSDILGDEDHLGDMDFKVAGTEAGITSLQMDIKIARHHRRDHAASLWIRRRVAVCTSSARWRRPFPKAAAELGEFAPRIEVMNIPVDKIREVIGSGGKVIREIVEKTGAKINIEDDGTVKIASSSGKEIEAARKWIHSIVAEPEVGQIYEGTVVKTR